MLLYGAKIYLLWVTINKHTAHEDRASIQQRENIVPRHWLKREPR